MDREIAYAKINLALHVRRRRDDGYHDLETLFAFCADGDVLEADELLPGDSDALAGVGQWGLSRLEVVGQFADGIGAMADNSVLKAYNWLEPQMAVRFRLTKNLPVASGIGGGSADAASALRLIHRLWCGDQHVFHFQTETATSEWRYADGELDIRHAAFPGLGRALGADVPVCVHSQTARGEGIGEKLT